MILRLERIHARLPALSPILSALSPLGSRLQVLHMHRFIIDGPLVGKMAEALPLLRELELHQCTLSKDLKVPPFSSSSSGEDSSLKGIGVGGGGEKAGSGLNAAAPHAEDGPAAIAAAADPQVVGGYAEAIVGVETSEVVAAEEELAAGSGGSLPPPSAGRCLVSLTSLSQTGAPLSPLWYLLARSLVLYRLLYPLALSWSCRTPLSTSSPPTAQLAAGSSVAEGAGSAGALTEAECAGATGARTLSAS